MGLFDAPNQVVQATVAAPQTHTSARADCTAATAKGLKDLTALPGKPGDLRGCIFNDVDMSGGVVMEGVEFDWSSFQRAILQDAKANGASFRRARRCQRGRGHSSDPFLSRAHTPPAGTQ